MRRKITQPFTSPFNIPQEVTSTCQVKTGIDSACTDFNTLTENVTSDFVSKSVYQLTLDTGLYQAPIDIDQNKY